MSAARVTGVQAYQLALAQVLRAAAEQLSAREYAVLLDLHQRALAVDVKRQERALLRWAA